MAKYFWQLRPADLRMTPETLAVVRESFGRVAYSFKAHLKMLDRYNRRIFWWKVVNAALLTITAAGTVDVLIRNEKASEYAAAGFAMLALFTSIVQLSTNYDRLADQHRKAALALWVIREGYIHLIADLRGGVVGADEARSRRDLLTDRTARVYEAAPDTDDKAYAAAQKALKENEDLTFSTREIDLMLPVHLREG